MHPEKRRTAKCRIFSGHLFSFIPMTSSTASKAQARAAARKIERALRKGWAPGKGPVCSFGKRRAKRQEGGQ
jgi:hypothetical protein